MELVPLEEDVKGGNAFASKHSQEIGHLLPLTEKAFKEYFPPEQSYLSLGRAKTVNGIMSYRPGRNKQAPMAWFRIIADTPVRSIAMVKQAELVALAQEKLSVRTTVLGYDSKKLELLNSQGYRVGASIPDAVSFEGRRYDYHFLYKELVDKFHYPVKREYARPGLYPLVEVKKPSNVKLGVRGYRREDRAYTDKFAVHNNVMRTIGSGVFPDLYPWVPGIFDQMMEAGRMIPIICEDEVTREPVGILDLERHSQDVLQHTVGLGMFVKAEYQGMGVGTMLMESMKVLAQRLHMTRVWLSVFEGNIAGQKLYRKSGFEECGSIPGWLQDGYVNEIFMTLKLN